MSLLGGFRLVLVVEHAIPGPVTVVSLVAVTDASIDPLYIVL